MSELKWERVTPVWRAPKSGLYAVKHENGAEDGLYMRPGEGLDFSGWPIPVMVAGPVEIAEPDPELRLPEGWKLESDSGTDGYWTKAVRCIDNGQKVSQYIYVRTTEGRVSCVRAVQAAVDALTPPKGRGFADVPLEDGE